MLTILIEDKESKIRALISQALESAGYPISSVGEKGDDMIKIIAKNAPENSTSLKEKVVELENALHKNKEGVLYKAVLEAIEKPLIEHILERTEGNQLKAARLLGINRNTMRAKIKKLKIDVTKWKR